MTSRSGLRRKTLLLISSENISVVKKKNTKKSQRGKIRKFEQWREIPGSAEVKGRGLLLPVIVTMIGLPEVNVTQTGKKIKAKGRRKGRRKRMGKSARFAF